MDKRTALSTAKDATGHRLEHAVETWETDHTPFSGHRAPKGAILAVRGRNTRGFRSAHRRAALETGRREYLGAEFTTRLSTEGRVRASAYITTYWI